MKLYSVVEYDKECEPYREMVALHWDNIHALCDTICELRSEINLKAYDIDSAVNLLKRLDPNANYSPDDKSPGVAVRVDPDLISETGVPKYVPLTKAVAGTKVAVLTHNERPVFVVTEVENFSNVI